MICILRTIILFKKKKDKSELVTIKSVIINIVYQQEGETEW